MMSKMPDWHVSMGRSPALAAKTGGKGLQPWSWRIFRSGRAAWTKFSDPMKTFAGFLTGRTGTTAESSRPKLASSSGTSRTQEGFFFGVTLFLRAILIEGRLAFFVEMVLAGFHVPQPGNCGHV